MTNKPWNTPIEEWPDGWLKLEIANLTTTFYLVMTNAEKAERNLPVTKEEMCDYIRKNLEK